MNIFDCNLRNTNQSPMTGSTGEKDGIRYDSDFSRIEELIKGNTFSREEITHLMEIINSRVENEWQKQKSSSNGGGQTQLVSWMPEILRTPSDGKQQDIDRAMIGAHREKLDGELFTSPTSVQSTLPTSRSVIDSENLQVPVSVSASPIDIALAYMAGRTLEGDQDLHNFMSNSERAQPNNEFARKPPLVLSPSPKPSICWPGAMVHDRHDFTTQSQRGTPRLHEFSRTPYSRSILSKSTTKSQAGTGYANTSTPFQQSQTSLYGQVKSRGETLDAYGSVGPIRRIRNKFASEVRPRGSAFTNFPKETPKISTPNVFGGFLRSEEKNIEHGETSGVSKDWLGGVSRSSDHGNSSQNISSNQAVRKIMEHLDRNKPSPKGKEAETMLVTNVSNVENSSSLHVEELASRKNADVSGPNFPMEFNRFSSKSKLSENFHFKGMDEAKHAVGESTKASSSISICSSKSLSGASAMPVFGLKETCGPLINNLNKDAFATNHHGKAETSLQFCRSRQSNGQDVKIVAGTSGSEVPKNHGTKPALPSISVKKPDLRAVSSDNGPGFTFPVSASSGVWEPPTPSVTPSSSASILSQPIGVPSYTFGAKKLALSLVFSFPSTSSASTDDASDLKFNFGSDNKKTRLSFSSLEQDAICY